MTDQTQTTTEPVAWRWEQQIMGIWQDRFTHERPDDGPRVRHVQPLYTTPQPLAIGLDRGAVAFLLDRLADFEKSLSDGAEMIVRDWYGHVAPALARTKDALALAAPAEGYVLVPVEPTEAMIEAGTRTVNSFGRVSNGVCNAYRKMVQIAACLPAAPTGETGA